MLLGANLLLTSNAHKNKTKRLFVLNRFLQSFSIQNNCPWTPSPPFHSFYHHTLALFVHCHWILSFSASNTLQHIAFSHSHRDNKIWPKKKLENPLLRIVNKQQFSENFSSIQKCLLEKHSNTAPTAQHILTHIYIAFCKSHLIYCWRCVNYFVCTQFYFSFLFLCNCCCCCRRPFWLVYICTEIFDCFCKLFRFSDIFICFHDRIWWDLHIWKCILFV